MATIKLGAATTPRPTMHQIKVLSHRACGIVNRVFCSLNEYESPVLVKPGNKLSARAFNASSFFESSATRTSCPLAIPSLFARCSEILTRLASVVFADIRSFSISPDRSVLVL